MYHISTPTVTYGTYAHPEENNEGTPYPINCFPEKLANMIEEQYLNNEIPISMIGTSLLGALSAAIQDKVDVETRSGALVPPIVWALVVSESGSRKTTVDKILSKPFNDFESIMPIELKPAMAVQSAKNIRWKADILKVEKKMKSTITNEEQNKLQNELIQILKTEPVLMQNPRILYQDTTPEAIYKGLMNWPSGLVSSSESGALFSGRTFGNLPQFNRFFDGGEDHRIDRIGRACLIVKNPRLTISLMVQPKTFEAFLSGKGQLARDSGFLARFLICKPKSLAGSRFGKNHTNQIIYQQAYQNRMLEILVSGVSPLGRPIERRIIKLSTAARISVKNFSDTTEARLADGHYLCDFRDAGSKLAEIANRVAALFHYYQGEDGAIPADTMNKAIILCQWHINEFVRLFSVPPQEIVDAKKIEAHLRKISDRCPGMNQVLKQYLMTSGPNSVRDKSRLDLALFELYKQGKINVQTINKKQVVMLNVLFFPAANNVPYQSTYEQGINAALGSPYPNGRY